MKKIKLSNDAKSVFRLLDKGIYQCPPNMHHRDFNIGSLELKRLGFSVCHQEESGDVIIARLTDEGKQYIAQNPTLHNPIDWKWIVGATIAATSLVVSIIALFVACSIGET